MGDRVQLVGLDFGSTTSSAVVASARLVDNRVTGRRELREVTPTYQSELVFTPFVDERIDLPAVRTLIDGWLRAGNVQPDALFGGGALITGLAAGQQNAAQLAELIRERLQAAVIATADDPILESFVSFMGSCAALSRADPQTPILNLDIGGGTTNLALGRAGEVLRTGCLFVGARHLRFQPGSYLLTGYSAHGRLLLDYLGIHKSPGAALSLGELDAVLDFYIELLTAACTGSRAPTPFGQKFEQVALTLPPELPPFKLAFSGGVGALIHARLAGDTTPPTTCYGDLGPQLAARIVRSELISAGVVTSGTAERATVYGLLAHSTVVSGTTIFVAQPDTLPLRELPILGRITSPCSLEALHQALLLVRRSLRGGALRLSLENPSPATLRTLGAQLAETLQTLAFPPTQPIVLLLSQNLGKVLGGYITGWRPPTVNLLVIDEVVDEVLRNARFVQLGRLHDQVVPVSFYALQS